MTATLTFLELNSYKPQTLCAFCFEIHLAAEMRKILIGQLSLLSLAGLEKSTGQSAVMLCSLK